MEKIEKALIIYSILFVVSFLLVFLGNQFDGLLCSICGFCGRLIQFPTSVIDLFLSYFNVEWLIFALGFLFLANRLIINN